MHQFMDHAPSLIVLGVNRQTLHDRQEPAEGTLGEEFGAQRNVNTAPEGALGTEFREHVWGEIAAFDDIGHSAGRGACALGQFKVQNTWFRGWLCTVCSHVALGTSRNGSGSKVVSRKSPVHGSGPAVAAVEDDLIGECIVGGYTVVDVYDGV